MKKRITDLIESIEEVIKEDLENLKIAKNKILASQIYLQDLSVLKDVMGWIPELEALDPEDFYTGEYYYEIWGRLNHDYYIKALQLPVKEESKLSGVIPF